MGLLTDSKSLRNKMLSRNIYTADKMYGLDNDIVTKTLDTFATLGMDLRTSNLLAGAERLIDNTELSIIGLKRLAVEIGRRVANNVFRKEIGVVNIDNIFSKDPNRKIIMRPEDFTITPKEKPVGLIEYLKAAAGYEAQTQTTVAGKETTREASPGGLEYYDNLGPAQKAKLHEQLAMNNYNRFPNGGDPYANLRAIPGRYTSVQDTYSSEFLRERAAIGDYGTYILDENTNSSLGAKTRDIANIADAVSAGVNNMRQIETEGFGRTSFPDHNEVPLDDSDRFFQYGDNPNMERFGVKRGMLYYTQQIMKGGGQIANALGRETKEYGIGERNVVVYRGSSPCRNFTMAKPLETYGQAMRFKGNGNPQSVVGESVMPRIYPVNSGDSSNLMFSIENLAYSREDLLGMPMSEQGPNEGRLMWFPPYALQYSLAHQAQWDTTSLLGRIEPMYTYNGVSRSVSISFMLLIDTPPHVMNMPKDEMAAWFQGCLDERPGAIDDINGVRPELIVPPIPPRTLTLEGKPDRFLAPLPLHFFQNDVFAIELDYEITKPIAGGIIDQRNRFALNASFVTRIDQMLQYMHERRKSNRRVYINIEGRCSALFTDIYNAKLSYRRAASLKDFIIAEYTRKFGETIVLMNDLSPADFTARIDKDNLNQTWVIPSKDGTLEISIVGRGEKFADAGSDEKRELNYKEAKNRRLAKVTVCRSEPIKSTLTTLTTPATPAEARNRRVSAAKRDTAETQNDAAQNGLLFRNQYTETTKAPSGWDNVDYYAPMFHSQTPYDMHKRRQFLQQLMFPGDTKEKTKQIGSNSLFGRMPVCIIRIADELHSKALINNLTLDMTESTWDVNPEGMGMQAMFLKVTIDATLIGGMSLKNPINRLQTATDFNHIANTSFYSDPYYSQQRWDYQRADKGDEFRKADSREESKDTKKG